jgi:F0F1-type ATP synthase membrane subunit b/b'
MENTKEQLEKEAAQRHMDTMDKKADVMGAQVKETVSDAKLGAVNLAENASDKAEDLKDDASDTWENVKDKAGDMYDDAKDKAEEMGDKISDKYDELKAKAKAALS